RKCTAPFIHRQIHAYITYSSHLTRKGIAMGHARVVIQVVSEHNFPPHVNMVISQSLVDRLRLPGHPVRATYGSASDTAFILTIRTKTPLVRISSQLASRLNITNQKVLNVRYDPRYQRLRFGPLLGILMNRDLEGSDK